MADETNDRITGVLRTLQIIIPCLAGGLLTFGLVAFFLRQGQANPGNGGALLGPIMVALTLTLVIARMVVPGLLVRGGCQRIARSVVPPSTGNSTTQLLTRDESEQLLGVYTAKTIVGGAILESAGFCNLIAYFIEGSVYSLALGVIMLVAILAGTPTRRALDNWLDQQQRDIRETRDSAGLR